MEPIKKIPFLVLMLLFMVNLHNCSSAKMLQNDIPFEMGGVYYQQSDLLINVYIPVKSNPKNIVLDSIYFQGKQTNIEYESDLFIGRFKVHSIQKQDIIMSSEPYAEYGNKPPRLPKKIPFVLKNDECVVSYKENNITKYFKISNVIKKE